MMEQQQLSPRLKYLIQAGLREPGVSDDFPEELPSWFDKDLFNRGRTFCKKYFFSVAFAEFLGLMIGYGVSRFLDPLIFTKNSDTPRKALKRAISTINHVMVWIEQDASNPQTRGFQDILKVRKIHRKVAQRLNAVENTELVTKAHPFDQGEQPSFYLHLQQDLASFSSDIIDLDSLATNFSSQFDMVFTQFSFVGIVIAHPSAVGIWRPCEQDLEGFIHCWRLFGWLLGIEDRFNLCAGSVEQVKQLCMEIESKLIVPHMSKVDSRYERMSRVLCDGVNQLFPFVSFEGILLCITNILSLDLKRTKKNISWMIYFQYLTLRFALKLFFLIPVINFVVLWILSKVSRCNIQWWKQGFIKIL